MFILHLWVTQGIESKAVLNPVAWDRTHGQEAHECKNTSHTNTHHQHLSKCNLHNNKNTSHILRHCKNKHFLHTNLSLKPRGQSCLAGMITQHPGGDREAEQEKNSIREKLGKPAQSFSLYNYLGRMMAELYKKSN